MRAVRLLRRLDGLLAAGERAMAVLLTILLVLAVAAAVVARNLIAMPSQNLLEAAPLLVLWLALVGASLALRRDRHIRLELVLRFAPPSLRRAARVLTGFFGAAVMTVLCTAAVGFVRGEIEIFGSRGWAGVVFPLFFAAAAFRFLLQAVTAAWDPEGRSR